MTPEATDLVIAAGSASPIADAPTADDPRYPVRSSRTPAMYSERTSADIQQGAELRSQWQDSLYAFKISVRKAMKERPNDAEPVKGMAWQAHGGPDCDRAIGSHSLIHVSKRQVPSLWSIR